MYQAACPISSAAAPVALAALLARELLLSDDELLPSHTVSQPDLACLSPQALSAVSSSTETGTSPWSQLPAGDCSAPPHPPLLAFHAPGFLLSGAALLLAFHLPRTPRQLAIPLYRFHLRTHARWSLPLADPPDRHQRTRGLGALADLILSRSRLVTFGQKPPSSKALTAFGNQLT